MHFVGPAPGGGVEPVDNEGNNLSTLNLQPSIACLHHFLHNLDISILGYVLFRLY